MATRRMGCLAKPSLLSLLPLLLPLLLLLLLLLLRRLPLLLPLSDLLQLPPPERPLEVSSKS